MPNTTVHTTKKQALIRSLISFLGFCLSIFAILFSTTVIASAQVSGSLWKISSNNLLPVNTSWGIKVPSLANLTCIGTDAGGLFEAGTCGGGGGSGIATTSLAASWPIILTVTNPAATFSWGGIATTSPFSNNQLVVTNGSGTLYTVASSSLNLPNTALQNSTISGVALGGSLFSLSTNSTLNGTSYNGSAAVSNWGLNLANANSWTGLQQFTNASSTLLTVGTNTFIQGNATSTFGAGIAGTYLNLTGTSASSTFANGLSLSSGCYAVSGNCLTAGMIGGGFTQAVNWATAAVLAGTPTYNNGTNGVGATLTEVGNGALAVDGNAPAAGDRVLVKNQSSAFQNGIYTVTSAGSGIAVYILTRATDYNTPTEITPGLNTYVIGGATNIDDTFAVSYTIPLTIGTTNLTYSESATVITTPVSIANGGTGLATIGASSTVAVSNGTALAWQKLDLGATVYGTLPIANGGTNAASFGTTNGILAYNGTSAVNFSGYTLTSSILTATNASTTALSASQSFFVGNNQVSGQRYPVWGYATSTVWAGTTTVDLLSPFGNGTLSSIQCATDIGTLNVQMKIAGTAVTPMFNASTTKGTITFTGSKTFNKGDDLSADFGTPATAPNKITCTGIATGF